MISDTLSVFDAFTDFLVSQPSLEEILAYELPEATQKHIQTLQEKAQQSILADEEKSELSNYAFYSTLITMLKAKIQTKLKKSEE